MSATRPATGTAVGRRAVDRDEVASRLVDALEVLLARDGASFAETSVVELVRAAGTSRTMFYKHFDDKNDLLASVTGDVVRRLHAAAASWWTLGPDATRADVRDALRVVVDAHRPHRLVMRAVAEAAAVDPRIARQLRSGIGLMVRDGEAYVRSAQETGAVRADVDAGRTVSWLAWMGERGFAELTSVADDDERDRLVEALADVVWFALYRPGPPRRPASADAG